MPWLLEKKQTRTNPFSQLFPAPWKAEGMLGQGETPGGAPQIQGERGARWVPLGFAGWWGLQRDPDLTAGDPGCPREARLDPKF